MNRNDILTLIRKHVSQRSGIDCRNYGDRASLMHDYRRILRDGRDARRMLTACELSSMPTNTLRNAFRAYSGRLSLDEFAGTLEYCTGQYFPTEYRAAACAVLSEALAMHYGAADESLSDEGGYSFKRAQSWAKRNLGRGIAGRWFR